MLTHRILTAIACALISGCSILIQVAEKPFEAVAHALEARPGSTHIDAVALQGELMRFSDSFHSTIIHAAGELRRGGKPPDPLKLLNIELHFSQNVLAAATGSNALANLLDMIVIVTLTRISVQDYWMPQAFGASAQPLLDACLEEEREIWKIASSVLTPREKSELHRAIGSWHDKNPQLKTLEDLRVSGFITEIARYARPAHSSARSVFDLLQIDPLASLDPAAREIAETRYFGERALYLMQRMPTLLRWQTEVLAMTIARMPEVTQTLADTRQLSEAADRLGRVAGQIPQLMSSEREKILAGVHSSATQLSALAERTQAALAAGDRMAQSATTTLRTFEDVQKALKPETGAASSSPVPINDYTALAEQVGITAAQINGTLTSLQGLTGGPAARSERDALRSLADELEQRGDRLIERLVRAGMMLIAGACLGLFAALMAYRLASDRWSHSRRSPEKGLEPRGRL
jgi:hypothetical protein